MNNWQLLFYFLSLLSVGLLATVSANNKLKKGTNLVIKAICWGMLIICSFYWVTSVPYIGSYLDLSSDSQKNTTEHSQVEINKENIDEIGDRVVRLEREQK